METIKFKLTPNRFENAGFFSKLSFWWIGKLLSRVCRDDCTSKDLYESLSGDESKALTNRLETNWKRQLNCKGKTSFIHAAIQTFSLEFIYCGFLFFAHELMCRICLPLLLHQLLICFRPYLLFKQQEEIIFASGIVGLFVIQIIIYNRYYLRSRNNGINLRKAICGIIYRKTLRLSQTANSNNLLDKTISLLLNDVSRFESMAQYIHAIWSAPIISAGIGYILWHHMQLAGLLGMLVIFVALLIQMLAEKITANSREERIFRTEDRYRFMEELIAGIQDIKICGLEIRFARIIGMARYLEFNWIRKSTYATCIQMILLLTSTKMALFVAMMSSILMYGVNDLHITSIFVLLAYYNALSIVFTQFGQATSRLFQTIVTMHRVQEFLELPGKDPKRAAGVVSKRISDMINYAIAFDRSEVAVSIKNLSARYLISSVSDDPNPSVDYGDLSSTGELPTLQNINVCIKKGSLVGVIGPSGSGKSSLLLAILKEMPLELGSICFGGSSTGIGVCSISYASQVPWVFPNTIRQNIIFGQKLDQKVYAEILKLCELTQDLELFPDGDLTVVGDCGRSLTNAQKAKIDLARAMYRVADIYLVDNLLGNIDGQTSENLFDKCLGRSSYLARKRTTRIFVTQQVQLLKNVDCILILKNGEVVEQGSPQDLFKRNVDISSFLDESSFTGDSTAAPFSSPFKNRRSSSKVSVNSDTSVRSVEWNKENVLVHHQLDERIIDRIPEASIIKWRHYGRLCGRPYLLAGVIVFFLMTQLFITGTDYWIAYWTTVEQIRKGIGHESHPHYHPMTNHTIAGLSHLYSFYGIMDTDMCIYINFALVISLLAIAAIRSLLFYRLCNSASKKLHNGMFTSILSASLSFFDQISSQRILNHFTYDINTIDELIPKSTLITLQTILCLLGTLILICLINVWFLLTIGLLIIPYAIMRYFYRNILTNMEVMYRQSRRLILTHMVSSLDGMLTIRAFQSEDRLLDEFDNLQDFHSGCCFSIVAVTAAFSFWLDCLSCILLATATFWFVLKTTETSIAEVGLALTQIIFASDWLRTILKRCSKVEDHLLSVDRTLDYHRLSHEISSTNFTECFGNLPIAGRIEFRHVFYRQSCKGAPILSNINFATNAKEKIGIITNSEAIRRALINILFRLYPINGSVLVDDIDISSVHLNELRRNISFIPQNPMIFSGTLRSNLDPLEIYTEVEIWQALKAVRLNYNSFGSSGLDTIVFDEMGLSAYQKQMIHIAKAILNNNRIVIIEINDIIEYQLNMQQLIQMHFSNCTVLLLASSYQLHMIIDCDRILIMDAGQIAEYDAPAILLENSKSKFYNLVNSLNGEQQAKLKKIVFDNMDNL